MQQTIRQCVGIDCAKDELAVSFATMDNNFERHIKANRLFVNSPDFYPALSNWFNKLRDERLPLSIVVEATGVYHEQVSLWLHGQGSDISVVLPNKIKHFAATEKIKTVTDKVSAQTIALFGLAKKLDSWEPPKAVYNGLRQLTRERDQLNAEMTVIKNQLHAERAGAWPNARSIARMEERLAVLAKQQKAIVEEIVAAVENDAELKGKVKNICTIKGIGLLTAVTVIAETNGFNLIRNRRQLTSYAGLDVQEKTSGTSVSHKPRISKKGNKYLRKAMHFPALSAVRHGEKMKSVYAGMVETHGIKMKAAVAVQRRLLELIYTLWKTDKPYDPNYKKEQKVRAAAGAALNEIA
jgi:transposase